MGSGILRGGKVVSAKAEGLSSYMDGASEDGYDALVASPELQELWDQYHLIGDVLRSDAIVQQTHTRINSKVRASLQREAIFLPQVAKRDARWGHWFGRYAAGGAAAAAAIAVVAWIVIPRMGYQQESPTVQVVKVAEPVRGASVAADLDVAVGGPVAVDVSASAPTSQMGPYFMAHQHAVFGRADLVSGVQSAQTRSGSDE